MYYRKQGETKWTRCTYAHWLNMCKKMSVIEINLCEVKHPNIDTPKQKRQKQIASVLRSMSCAVAQLGVVRCELGKVETADLPKELTDLLTLMHFQLDARLDSTKLMYDELKECSKEVAKANKESNTP